MKMSNIEKETIIYFNEEESNVEVYTHNVKLINRFNKAVEEYPDVFKIKTCNEYGGITYIMPKKKLGIRPIKPVSEERSKMLSDRIKKTQPLKYKGK